MTRTAADSRTENTVIPTTTEILGKAIVDLVLRDVQTGPELLLWTPTNGIAHAAAGQPEYAGIRIVWAGEKSTIT